MHLKNRQYPTRTPLINSNDEVGSTNLVLASSSPRRQELLKRAGITFIVDPPEILELDSSSNPELSAGQLALLNAQRKAWAVAQRHPASVILAADTLVVCQGKVFGKPVDLSAAKAMLRQLSGKTHQVITGVCFSYTNSLPDKTDLETSHVSFRTLDEPTLELYLSRVHVLDKAGAYALQEQEELIIERVEGSRSNVIGLPMEIVLPLLKDCLR